MITQRKIFALLCSIVFLIGCSSTGFETPEAGKSDDFSFELRDSSDGTPDNGAVDTLQRPRGDACDEIAFEKTGGQFVVFVYEEFQGYEAKTIDVTWLLEEIKGCENPNNSIFALDHKGTEDLNGNPIEDSFDVDIQNVNQEGFKKVEFGDRDWYFTFQINGKPNQSGNLVFKSFFDLSVIDKGGKEIIVAELEIRWNIMVSVISTRTDTPTGTNVAATVAPTPTDDCKSSDDCGRGTEGTKTNTPVKTTATSGTPITPGATTVVPTTPVTPGATTAVPATPITPDPTTAVPATPITPDSTTAVPATPIIPDPATAVPATPVPPEPTKPRKNPTKDSPSKTPRPTKTPKN